METRQLKYFMAVAEELHFGNAAKRLHISQPPLSQQIKKFEDELGVRLFHRNRRSVQLTPAGKSLMEDARNILQSIEQARINLTDATNGSRGQISLGYVGPALNTALPNVISSFKTAYPNVWFNLRQMSTNGQLKAIRSGTLDAGVVRFFRHDTEGLELTLFHQEVYAVIVAVDHEFATRQSVDMAELANERLIFFRRKAQPSLYDEWMRLFAQCGFTPKIVQEVETKSAALALTAARMGISIVPQSLSSESRGGVKFLNLTGEYPPLEIHFVTRKGDTAPTTRNLAQLIEQFSVSSL